ncbi:hypothetical protein ACWJJH_01885 [Endozoicomonadaceae bacterium StTr2]
MNQKNNQNPSPETVSVTQTASKDAGISGPLTSLQKTSAFVAPLKPQQRKRPSQAKLNIQKRVKAKCDIVEEFGSDPSFRKCFLLSDYLEWEEWLDWLIYNHDEIARLTAAGRHTQELTVPASMKPPALTQVDVEKSSECLWLQTIYQWAQESCRTGDGFALDEIKDWLKSQQQYRVVPLEYAPGTGFISFLRTQLQQTSTCLVMKLYSADYDMSYFFCFERSPVSRHCFLLSDGIGEYASYMVPGRINDLQGFLQRMEKIYIETESDDTHTMSVTVCFFKCEKNDQTNMVSEIDEPD